MQFSVLSSFILQRRQTIVIREKIKRYKIILFNFIKKNNKLKKIIIWSILMKLMKSTFFCFTIVQHFNNSHLKREFYYVTKRVIRSLYI